MEGEVIFIFLFIVVIGVLLVIGLWWVHEAVKTESSSFFGKDYKRPAPTHVPHFKANCPLDEEGQKNCPTRIINPP